jgi:hypothetical protein
MFDLPNLSGSFQAQTFSFYRISVYIPKVCKLSSFKISLYYHKITACNLQVVEIQQNIYGYTEGACFRIFISFNFSPSIYVSDRHSKAQITNHSLRINLLYLTALWRSHFYLTLSKATWAFVITWHLLTFHIWIYRRSSIMIAHFILIHRCQPLRFFRNFYEFRAKVTVLLSTVYLLRIFDYCQPGTVPHLNIIVII